MKKTKWKRSAAKTVSFTQYAKINEKNSRIKKVTEKVESEELRTWSGGIWKDLEWKQQATEINGNEN